PEAGRPAARRVPPIAGRRSATLARRDTAGVEEERRPAAHGETSFAKGRAMSGSPHFADNAWHGAVTLEENVRLARDTYRARLHCPELARRIVPGQFLMLRLAGYDDPLLGRPLALYDTVCDAAGNPVGVDVVYLVIGKMTSRLARYR